MLRDFATRCLLPRLEERIGRLNTAVTVTRKGLKNSLSRLWKGGLALGGGGGNGGSGGGAGGGGGGGGGREAPYPWHSIDSQMRQLGDLAFLMRNYEFAAGMYRLAAGDYQANGNHKWYAGAQVRRAAIFISIFKGLQNAANE